MIRKKEKKIKAAAPPGGDSSTTIVPESGDRYRFSASIISTALVDEAGQIYAIATTERARKKKDEILL